ncbi:MAG: hypothetical protein LBR36_02705 [Bacteroidales bacterium]|jgi:hypothetical protein|nr:hypothetical protein [Bacteroidales bacterium]
MKRYTLIFSLILALGSTYSQEFVNKFVTLDTVLLLPTEKLVSQSSVQCALWEDTIVFFNYDAKYDKDTIKFYFLEVNTYQCRTKKMVICGLAKDLANDNTSYIDCFAYNGRHIVLGYSQRLWLFEIKDDTSFMLLQTIPENWQNQITAFIDDSYLIQSNVYYSQPIPAYIKKIGVNTFEWQFDNSQKQSESFLQIKYMHPIFGYFSPRHFLDVKYGKILLTNRTTYSATIFDDNFAKDSQIETKKRGWIEMNAKKIQKITDKYDKHDAGAIIAEVSKYIPKISQLIWGYFLDSNKILLAYQTPEDGDIPKVFIDIWTKNGENWVLDKENIEDIIHFQPENGCLRRQSFGLSFLSGYQYLFTESKVFVFQHRGTNVNPIDMNAKQFYAAKNKFYLENGSSVLNIYVFSHSF